MPVRILSQSIVFNKNLRDSFGEGVHGTNKVGGGGSMAPEILGNSDLGDGQ
jgi:hypothetical protein